MCCDHLLPSHFWKYKEACSKTTNEIKIDINSKSWLNKLCIRFLNSFLKKKRFVALTSTCHILTNQMLSRIRKPLLLIPPATNTKQQITVHKEDYACQVGLLKVLRSRNIKDIWDCTDQKPLENLSLRNVPNRTHRFLRDLRVPPVHA